MIIREILAIELAKLQATQRRRNYRRGWIWWQLKGGDLAPFTLDEFEYVAAQLRYKPSWADVQFALQEQSEEPEPEFPSALAWACDALGLTPPFTQRDLKQAYRSAALEAQRDTGGSALAFRLITQAYEALLPVVGGAA